ncbi:LysM and putative peptidoglycan-binding domain-containing protein 1 [Toxocara canis]|uniref:LysM and putative peptidoglycan-binding domain-containing protein 1 n=1 Tax=Toxocara canis TaxID=6265 RepID=A0A0B2V194_TOXCA|nr:LysM and putative peptidoglycan-binding domain-containing protein 1 [Toxocara canis]
MEEHDEHTFLCGYQRTRGYGSTSRPQSSTRRYTSVVRHQVEPTDTLQGLVLRYNTSMTEIKRLNRLWSNESLYLKPFINIPIYEINASSSEASSRTESPSLRTIEEHNNVESVEDIFKRIDSNIKKTTSNVRRLEKNSSADWNMQRAEQQMAKKTAHRYSLNSMSGYQTPT